MIRLYGIVFKEIENVYVKRLTLTCEGGILKVDSVVSVDNYTHLYLLN